MSCQLPWGSVLQKMQRISVRKNHKAAKMEINGPEEGHSLGPWQRKGSKAKAAEVRGAQVVIPGPRNKVQPNCSLMNPLCANSSCLLSKHTYPSPGCCSLGQDFWRRGRFNICKELVFGPLMQLFRVRGVYLCMQPQCTPFPSLNHHRQSSEAQPGVPLLCWMQDGPPMGLGKTPMSKPTAHEGLHPHLLQLLGFL